MTKPATQAERLTVLETEARMRAEASDKAMKAVADELRKINERLDQIESEHRATNERLSAYENKGKGVLIGVGLLGTGMGATILAVIAKFAEWFK